MTLSVTIREPRSTHLENRLIREMYEFCFFHDFHKTPQLQRISKVCMVCCFVKFSTQKNVRLMWQNKSAVIVKIIHDLHIIIIRTCICKTTTVLHRIRSPAIVEHMAWELVKRRNFFIQDNKVNMTASRLGYPLTLKSCQIRNRQYLHRQPLSLLSCIMQQEYNRKIFTLEIPS